MEPKKIVFYKRYVRNSDFDKFEKSVAMINKIAEYYYETISKGTGALDYYDTLISRDMENSTGNILKQIVKELKEYHNIDFNIEGKKLLKFEFEENQKPPFPLGYTYKWGVDFNVKSVEYILIKILSEGCVVCSKVNGNELLFCKIDNETKIHFQ